MCPFKQKECWYRLKVFTQFSSCVCAKGSRKTDFKKWCASYTRAVKRDLESSSEIQLLHTVRTQSFLHCTSSLWSISYSSLVNASTSDKTLFRSWEKKWEELVLFNFIIKLEVILKYTDNILKHTLMIFWCAASSSLSSALWASKL